MLLNTTFMINYAIRTILVLQNRVCVRFDALLDLRFSNYKFSFVSIFMILDVP